MDDTTVASVMTRDVTVTRPDSSVQEAARVMRQLNVGSVPVCTGRKLVGMLTDRDIAIRLVAEGRDPTATAASEIMTPGVIYLYDDQSVQEAADTMSAHQIRRLPIVNRDKELVGIVALGDLALEASSGDGEIGSVLEEISEPATSASWAREGA
jgi:CBS domain-containing protein